MKSAKLFLLIACLVGSAVSAQVVNRPTPASSITTARAVDNFIRPYVPTNGEIGQIAYDTVAANRATLFPGGTGMRAVLAPLKGKTLYCSSGGHQAWAYVDGNGDPFVRMAGMYIDGAYYDSGWVPDFGVAQVRDGYVGSPETGNIYSSVWRASWSLNGGLVYSYSPGDGNPSLSCYQRWPPT